MKRARTNSGRTANGPVGSAGGSRYERGSRNRRSARGFRPGALPGFLALVLASAAACSAPTVASGGSTTSPAAVSSAAPAQPNAGAQPSLDPATAEAKTRVGAALDRAAAAGGKPAAERIRAAIAGAGFTDDQVQVTASRTPTGLDSDAVEAAVRVGTDCIVAQLRTGSVTVSVLPVLADGACLVAAPA